MNLISGLFFLLGSQSIGVFGYHKGEYSSLGETLDKCIICIRLTDKSGNKKSSPNTFRIPSGARRHEFLVRSSEEQAVSIYFYDGSEPADSSLLTLSSGKSHTATVTQESCLNITILQPKEDNRNAEVHFSDQIPSETFRDKPITYLVFKISKPLLVCSCGLREECNGKEHTNLVPGTADANKEDNSNNSVTGGCSKTMTIVLGILLALSVMINKILLIRICLRHICSNDSDKGPILEPNTNASHQGLELRNSGHISENSLYGAVINRS